MKSWMIPSSKKQSGTQQMKSCELNVDTQKNCTYIFPSLEKCGQPKITKILFDWK